MRDRSNTSAPDTFGTPCAQTPGGELPEHGVSWDEAVRAWTYIGLNSFGGPTGQIAVMHKVLVEEKRWISEERFLHALNLCMLLPGPEAMQLVTYVGWLLHRARGGIVAGLLFVLPGFVSILALSVAYTALGHVAPIAGLLFGLKAAVLAIVLEAVIRIGKRVLKDAAMYVIAAVSFIALFAFHAPFPAVIATAAVVGLIGGRLWPDTFAVMKPKSAGTVGGTSATGSAGAAFATDRITPETAPHTRPSLRGVLSVLAVWLPLWLAPVVALRWWLGPANVFAAQGVFFSKAAVVTFGGAYAVLAYVAQQAVDVYGWLEPGEMLTGLGLAETTPGPLIMVLQFVAYVGAFRQPGSLDPTVAGVLASLLAAWTTFVPCFMWIFLGAPFMEAIRGRKSLAAALSCITAAVVGVVLNLAVWFTTHTLFGTVIERTWTFADSPRVALAVPVPDLGTLDIAALSIALVAAALIFIFKRGVLVTLAACAALGVAWRLLGTNAVG